MSAPGIVYSVEQRLCVSYVSHVSFVTDALQLPALTHLGTHVRDELVRRTRASHPRTCTAVPCCISPLPITSALMTQMAEVQPDFNPDDVVMVRGGIERYLKTFPGGGYWKGKNYLFDRRMEQLPELQRAEAAEVGSVCALCNAAWSEYRGKHKCTNQSCKVPVIVCQSCQSAAVANPAKLQCTCHATLRFPHQRFHWYGRLPLFNSFPRLCSLCTRVRPHRKKYRAVCCVGRQPLFIYKQTNSVLFGRQVRFALRGMTCGT